MTEAGGYDEDSVPTGGSGAPDEGDTGGKADQQTAHYRRGMPVKSCGVCMMFTKEGDGNDGGCTKVDGTISPYGLCDYYAEAANPFGPTLGPQERAVVDEMSQSGPDQSRFASMGGGGSPAPMPAPPSAEQAPPVAGGPPRMRIGRQAY
jgi:hypothetical protein